MSKQQFQTEVSQLLQLIVHSLYSHPEIFLRELISNSSDALDKLRHLTLTDDTYKALVGNGIDSPRIDLELDEANKTLTISDTGIGMNEEDLVSHLGTIARSGTKNFLSQLSGDAKKDSNLIGQFGVGFYSVFMVADKVEVISRKAGEDAKPGAGPATARPASSWKKSQVTPHARAPEPPSSSTSTTKARSTPTAIACRRSSGSTPTTSPSPSSSPTTRATGTPKRRSPPRRAPPSRSTQPPPCGAGQRVSLVDDDYKELYKSISHDWEDPLFWFHTRAEGTLEYTTLFYIPAKAPLDLYQMEYKGGVKLYVKRVFIMDDSKELLPQYLRFVRGIIDSEDLPLNVSREILQQNKILTSIKTASVKKILSELKTIATDDPDKYKLFIAEYNRPLKEGLYGDYANRETLLDLIRFKSTKVEGLTSLADAKSRMQPEQKSLYYITGGTEALLRNSPLLEVYKKKDIEVLILDDDIDEIVFSTVDKYGEIDLKAVNKGGSQRRPEGRSRAREG